MNARSSILLSTLLLSLLALAACKPSSPSSTARKALAGSATCEKWMASLDKRSTGTAADMIDYWNLYLDSTQIGDGLIELTPDNMGDCLVATYFSDTMQHPDKLDVMDGDSTLLSAPYSEKHGCYSIAVADLYAVTNFGERPYKNLQLRFMKAETPPHGGWEFVLRK